MQIAKPANQTVKKMERHMLIFVNTCPESRASRRLEEKLIHEIGPEAIEVYHQLPAFLGRIRKKIHDVRLLIICLLEAHSLKQAEAAQTALDGLPLVLVIHSALESESRRLYAFYPRIVLRISEDDAAVLEFAQAKIRPCGIQQGKTGQTT